MKRLQKELAILVALMVSIQFGITSSWGAIRQDPDICPEGADCGTPIGPVVPVPSIRFLSRISTVNTYGSGRVYDMELAGNRLYLANIYYDPVIDVSNPYSPYLAYEIEHAYNGGNWANKVAGNRYYGVGLRLEAWDISGSTPSFLGASSTLAVSPTDIDVVNNRAYTVVNGDQGQVSGRYGILEIWDVANPQKGIPRLGSIELSRYLQTPHPPNPHSVIVEGNRAFVGMEGLNTIDITNPATPSVKGRLDVRAALISVNNRDDMEKVYRLYYWDHLFKGHKSFGILVINKFFPDYPWLQGIIGPPAIAVDDIIAFEVVPEKNRLFVATPKDFKFKVLDISDIRNVKVLAEIGIVDIFDPRAGADHLEVEIEPVRGLAFVAGDQYLNIYDISDFLQ